MPRRNDISKVLVTVLALVTLAAPCEFEIKGPAATVDRACGIMLDPSGQELSNMSLTIRHWKRHETKIVPPVATAISDGQGRFDFGVIAPGKYLLSTDDKRWQLTVVFEVLEDQRSNCKRPMYAVPNIREGCGGGMLSMKRSKAH